jgi:4-amino-4-deoxy-L-arabinose transferase-like glycosyltransferase
MPSWRGFFDPERRVGLALGALGVAFGSVSLSFPFGRDQGAFFYVAREWLRHGAVPYRDAFEQKPPGVLMAHALAIALFGEHMVSIRVLELACVVALGLVCARLATPADEPVPPGIGGAAVLVACVLYFGFFDFWNTAQCEIWCTTAAMGSACVVARARAGPRALLLGGALGGLALLFKPPAAPLVAFAAFSALARAAHGSGSRAKRVGGAALLYGAGVAAPATMVAAYFALAGGLAAAIDVQVGANGWYLRHQTNVEGVFEVLRRSHGLYKLFEPVSALLLEAVVLGLVVGVVRGDRALRDRHAAALAACACAFAGVLVQMKLYLYHWGLMVGPATLVAANVALDVAALARWRWPTRATTLAAALFAGNFTVAYALTGRAANRWGEEMAAAAGWLSGRTDEVAFGHSFDSPDVDYPFEEARETAAWLRDHTSPTDEVAVRGFDAEIYAMARRRFHGRFFCTNFLSDPNLAYRRDEWLREDRAVFEQDPPRWIVTWVNLPEVPDAPSTFLALGYVERARIGSFVILER